MFALITWLLLLVLSALQGVALGSAVKVPFLFDFASSIRYLIAGPLLIIAEIMIDPRIRDIVKHFIMSGLIREEDLKGFENAVHEALKPTDSSILELVILAIIVFYSISGIKLEFLPGNISTWHSLASGSIEKVTLAGMWYAGVSRPFLQFLFIRWLWKLCIWDIFLWRISRLNLHLMPTHPDLAGGLGFLGSGQAQFGILVLSVSTVFASTIGERIIFGGESLSSFKVIIVAYVVLQQVLFLGPLLVFSPLLLKIKRKGLLVYGALATTYTQSFDNKWISGNTPQGEILLGSSDIQSLADLANSFQIVNKMNIFPIDRGNIIFIVAASVIPILPLFLTVIPLDEILLKVMKLLF